MIDRDTAGRIGVNPQTIDDTLYDAFGQRQVSIIFTQLNTYRVILGAAPEFKEDTSILSQVYLRAQSNELVPLSAFAHFEQGEADAPSSRTRGSFLRSRSRSTSRTARRSATRSTPCIAPSSAPVCRRAFTLRFQGTAAAFITSLASEPFLILAALITVYIVLGVLYESFIHPITILSTLPSAGVGAALALMVDGIGVRRHRAHRHRAAHRHREEERDHDDRFCHRSGAR